MAEVAAESRGEISLVAETAGCGDEFDRERGGDQKIARVPESDLFLPLIGRESCGLHKKRAQP